MIKGIPKGKYHKKIPFRTGSFFCLDIYPDSNIRGFGDIRNFESCETFIRILGIDPHTCVDCYTGIFLFCDLPTCWYQGTCELR